MLSHSNSPFNEAVHLLADLRHFRPLDFMANDKVYLGYTIRVPKDHTYTSAEIISV